MFKIFNLFSPKFKSGQFILTKKYISDGIQKGGIVLQIEHILGQNLACSKGSFQIIENSLEWVLSEDRLVQISFDNVERILSKKEAIVLLSENIKRIKNSKKS